MAAPAAGVTAAEHLENLARAKRWFAWIAEGGNAVIADWIIYCEVWNDFDPCHRERGFALIRRCDEYWMVGGRVSSGMARGRAVAEAAGVPVVDMTPYGEEPGGLVLNRVVYGARVAVAAGRIKKGPVFDAVLAFNVPMSGTVKEAEALVEAAIRKEYPSLHGKEPPPSLQSEDDTACACTACKSRGGLAQGYPFCRSWVHR